jgi:hypothetical protein
MLVSSEELIRYANEKGGHRVSLAALKKWRIGGLLPRARRRRGLGRGRGTVWLYPSASRDQLVELCIARSLSSSRRLGAVAWYMWLKGFPVTAVVRSYLRRDFDGPYKRARDGLRGFERGPRQSCRAEYALAGEVLREAYS